MFTIGASGNLRGIDAAHTVIVPNRPDTDTPSQWARARLDAPLSVADLARHALGTAANLRAQMRRRTGLSPSQYRDRFAPG